MKPRLSIISAVLAGFLVLTSLPAMAQRQHFEAQAMGEGTQMGRTFAISIIIEQYSPPTDQKVLLDAFTSGGMDGLVKTISKMRSKGRVSLPGTTGYEITYIRVFKTPTGRKIRLVTDRPITFGEAFSASRSRDYSLSAIELEIDSNGKGTGTLLPACQFKFSKEKELEIEAYQNPWRLTNVFEWK